MKKIIVSVFALTMVALVSNGAMATVPDLIPIQGVLADDLGAPIDGATDIAFSLYAAQTGGTALWTDTFTAVDVVDGFFTVYLGSDTALDFSTLLTNPAIWLGINVEADGEMARIQVTTVPFAIEAQVCQSLGSLTEADINSDFAPIVHNHDADYADIVHNHDADYADITHNHDAAYAAISHNHDAAYAPISHAHAWSTITGMPAGFADGIDDTGSATYTAGAGLTLTGTTFSANFAGTGAATTVARSDHNHDATYVNEAQANSVTTAMITDGTIDGADLEANFTYTGNMTVTGTMSVTGTQFGMTRVYLGANGTLFTHPAANVTLTWDSANRVLTFNNNSGAYWDAAMSGPEDADYGTADENKSQGIARDVGNTGTLALDGNNQNTGFAFGFNVTAAREGLSAPGFTFTGAGYGGGISGLVTYWY